MTILAITAERIEDADDCLSLRHVISQPPPRHGQGQAESFHATHRRYKNCCAAALTMKVELIIG